MKYYIAFGTHEKSTLSYANDAFFFTKKKNRKKFKLKIFKFKLNGGNFSYNDDAPKRSGGIEEAARYVEEIVAVNVYTVKNAL